MGFIARVFGTIPYAMAFCCAAIVLGFYSYFLAVLSDRDRPIPTWEKAVEGISGAGVFYTLIACVLTPCFGGVSFLAFLCMVLDVAFCGGFIALAVLTRDGLGACTGVIDTPLGKGNAETGEGYGSKGFGVNNGENATYQAKFGTACMFNKACCAVSIIGAVLFVICAVVEFFLARRHKKESRFGPSPANNYTSGTGKGPFWKRNKTAPKSPDSELGTYGAGAPASTLPATNHVDTRPSADTAYTGSTVGANDNAYGAAYNKPDNRASGYYSQPTGTAMGNPYGYDKSAY